jgi:hypothetical protein
MQQTYRGIHSLGQNPNTAPAPAAMHGQQQWIEVPAFYSISLIIGGNAGDQVGGSVALRPERFVCRRITYAAQADAPPFNAIGIGSPTGRVVEISWGDEFTKFLGEQPALLTALFGGSNGFLDLPAGILFQGRQSLNAKLRRLNWADSSSDPADTRIDIVFHGVGLLPSNTGGVSGSL